jgi:hypothetical protein
VVESGEAPETPGWVQTIHWLQHQISINWHILKRPPILALFFITAGFAYFFGITRESEIVRIQQERISLLAQELSEYKDRLQGATPDQAAKEISDLRNRANIADEKLHRLMPETPRRLKEKQKEYLLTRLNDIRNLQSLIPVFASTVAIQPDMRAILYCFSMKIRLHLVTSCFTPVMKRNLGL